MYWYHVSRGLLKILYSGSFMKLLLNIDRLGNALAGGSHMNTISGRVGSKVITSAHPFWQFLERVINTTFAPIDGKNHCYKAFLWEASRIEHIEHRRSSDVALSVLAVLSVLGCVILFPVIRVIALFKKSEDA